MNSEMSFLTNDQKHEVEIAIKEAEKLTSGEIRVHLIKDKNIKDILSAAKIVFKKLSMHKTKDRNGIILVIAPNARQFAIFGDKGINEKIADGFWDKVRDDIKQSFKQEKYVEGIKNAVLETGKVLKNFSPIQHDDINELSNEVTES